VSKQCLSLRGFPISAEKRPVLRICEKKTTAGMWMWIAAIAISLLPSTCSAQSTCPWLNAATASGVLGGPASIDVNSTGSGSGVCEFRLQDGTANDSLRIEVMKADKPENAGKEMLPYESKCASSELPLKGVGNEAISCVGNAELSHSELVVGRVRDNIFTVAISVGTGNDPSTLDAIKEKAEGIARQVAGSLF